MVTAICAFALASATLSFAGTWDRRMDVTFDKPVAIPGVHLKGMDTLPAGSYVFRIGNDVADRPLVVIYNKEMTKVYATILALPDTRTEIPEGVVITFREVPVGEPAALHSLFLPGEWDGAEFVYAKK